MFDLITGATERPLRERSPVSKAVAVVLHVVVVGSLVAVALTQATKVLPTAAPTIMAFVAPPPAPPPPPPPPAAPAAPKPPRTVAQPPKPAPIAEPAAPVEVPHEPRPEPDAGHAIAGVEGGVEGGVAGGAVGGAVGGLVSEAAPPPPAPKAPQAPVRIGGQIHEPALIRRVEPVYPSAAAVTHLTGLVILEAVVDQTGCIESVKVLRSRHPLLDNAAIDALKQWQYAPLMLNGTPVSFVLTVTFNFSVQGQNRGH